ncbi:MAG TPA: hypothetical protein VH415_01415 [Nitrososphaeraceae archaeon]
MVTNSEGKRFTIIASLRKKKEEPVIEYSYCPSHLGLRMIEITDPTTTKKNKKKKWLICMRCGYHLVIRSKIYKNRLVIEKA